MLCPRALCRISQVLVRSQTQTSNSLQNVLSSLWYAQVSRLATSISGVSVLQTKSRGVSTSTSGVSLHELRSRGLVELHGPDTLDFLQGLVTSDVAQLKESGAQYSMMLNVKGRVLYDLLLYFSPGHGDTDLGVLVECDRSVVDEMVKVIRRYRIRKKVEIRSVTEEWKLFAALGTSEGVPTGASICVPDPRVPSFGWRLLQQADKQDVAWKDADLTEEVEYHRKRYEWGIPEGVGDLPPGNCLPLESNLVYHNGVSFQKGCYVGQELTARTHHTGVIRKRLMPLLFKSDMDGSVEPGTSITREDGRGVGKFRSCVGKYGLGLMRVADLRGTLTMSGTSGEAVPLSAYTPEWWPQDSAS